MIKALSLMEVLVSIILITVVIAALLSIKQNNLSIMEKSNEKEAYRSYISVLAYDIESINNRNKNIFLSDVLDMNDTDFKEEINSIKINVKDEIIESKDVKNSSFSYSLIKSTYKIEEKITNSFFTLKIEK